jgi:hypothetical protein
LGLLIRDYCEAPGAEYVRELEPYLPRMQARDISLDGDPSLHQTLREAGDDAVMREVPFAFFDRVYRNPAVPKAGATGIATPLGVAVVYDSVVHGSWNTIRDWTTGFYYRFFKLLSTAATGRQCALASLVASMSLLAGCAITDEGAVSYRLAEPAAATQYTILAGKFRNPALTTNGSDLAEPVMPPGSRPQGPGKPGSGDPQRRLDRHPPAPRLRQRLLRVPDQSTAGPFQLRRQPAQLRGGGAGERV